MNLQLIILDGYGYFVWPSFIFTFLSCFILFKKTKEELQKQEKFFLAETKNLSLIKVKAAKSKHKTSEVLSGSLI